MPRRHSVARCRHRQGGRSSDQGGARLNRDRLVQPSRATGVRQTVSSTGFDCYSKVLSVVPLRSHLGRPPQRHAPAGERVSLHNHRRGWFAVVPCSRKQSQRRRASTGHRTRPTASIHFSASSSRDGSSAATCRATRRRTVLGSWVPATTKRSSFKPTRNAAVRAWPSFVQLLAPYA